MLSNKKRGIVIKRIVIIGLGSIGSRHLRLIREISSAAEVRVLKFTVREKYSDSSGLLLSTIEEVLQFDPQIAIIANPATFHVAVAQKLAEAGVNLLIEKPISTSTEGVLKLIETCQKQKLVLVVGYNLRYLPSLQYFKELIELKTIGNIFSIRCEVGQYLPDWRPEKNYQKSVSAQKELGGGVLLELSHEIDYLRWIFGEVSWVRSKLSKQSNLDIDVEDSASVILGFKSNKDQQELLCSLNLDFIRHDRTRWCIAIGESGSLRWDGLSNKVDIYPEGSKKWKNLLNDEDDVAETYKIQWKHFLECVNSGVQPQVTGEDGLRVVEIIQAIQQSAIKGREEVIELSRSIDKIET